MSWCRALDRRRPGRSSVVAATHRKRVKEGLLRTRKGDGPDVGRRLADGRLAVGWISWISMWLVAAKGRFPFTGFWNQMVPQRARLGEVFYKGSVPW